MNYNFVEKVNSTNSFLKENAYKFPDWFILRAGEQTNGYGRFERIWQCEKNKDIAMSMIIPVDKKILPYAANLTQIVGLSIAEILQDFVPVKIKWANDILVEDRKICGILLNGISSGESMKIIAGIGLNVNSQREKQGGIFAVSLFDRTQKIFDLDELAKKIVKKIIENIEILSQSGLSEFIEKLNNKLAFKGETKTIIDCEKKITGIILGVGENGELIMQTDNGVQKFISGEIGFEK
jgi:BirA family biotin operon repressor/biotin-[acetyl-CoA-carboxylase] ligase